MLEGQRRAGRIAHTGEDDHCQIWCQLVCLGHQFDTTHLRHLEIADDDVGAVLSQHLKCIMAIAGRTQMVPAISQGVPHDAQEGGVGVDEQDIHGRIFMAESSKWRSRTDLHREVEEVGKEEEVGEVDGAVPIEIKPCILRAEGIRKEEEVVEIHPGRAVEITRQIQFNGIAA